MRDEKPKPTDESAGAMSSEDAPSHEAGAPPIGDEEQEQGQTSHPAPEDDVGVGENR